MTFLVIQTEENSNLTFSFCYLTLVGSNLGFSLLFSYLLEHLSYTRYISLSRAKQYQQHELTVW